MICIHLEHIEHNYIAFALPTGADLQTSMSCFMASKGLACAQVKHCHMCVTFLC